MLDCISGFPDKLHYLLIEFATAKGKKLQDKVFAETLEQAYTANSNIISLCEPYQYMQDAEDQKWCYRLHLGATVQGSLYWPTKSLCS